MTVPFKMHTRPEIIKAAMEKRGMSFEDVARASGVNVDRLAFALHGGRALKAAEFEAVCKALGLTVRDFPDICMRLARPRC